MAKSKVDRNNPVQQKLTAMRCTLLNYCMQNQVRTPVQSEPIKFGPLAVRCKAFPQVDNSDTGKFQYNVNWLLNGKRVSWNYLAHQLKAYFIQISKATT